jgi:polygalacturonase
VVSKTARRGAAFRAGILLAGCLVALSAAAETSAPQTKAPPGCAAPPTASLVINVKDKGAKGDGATDDTAAIQAAIDAVAGTGGTVLVPKGTYMVDGVGKKERLALGSTMTLKLSEGAVLKVIPNDSRKYSALTISGVSNVTVAGGTLMGERTEHVGTSGEGGMGVRITDGAQHVTISGVTAKAMWGDGFYAEGATDVKFCAVTADSNRRQGLSIIEADGVTVTDSVFKNTNGTRPSAGIDLEPDKPEQEITNVRIQNSKFIDNAGPGIKIAGKRGHISKIELTRNIFQGNRPILVENAPAILVSAICGNRQVTPQSPPSDGPYAFADPVDMVVHQDDCVDGRDMRFEVNRETRKQSR